MRKYLWVGLISARSNLAYLGEAVSRLFFLAVILYIFLKLWQVVYGETGATSLAGLTLKQMLWYLTITESIIMSGPRVSQVVDEDVRTGALAVQLIKPISYPLYRLSATLGERIVRFLICLGAGSVIALILVGPIQFSVSGLLFFALSLPLAFALDFLGNFLVGLGAFWLEDTNGLALIYSRITMILGGMLLPLDLFPASIQPVFKALPFATIVYGPAKLFVMPELSWLGDLLIRQGIGVAGFGLAVSVVYRTALNRVYANGG